MAIDDLAARTEPPVSPQLTRYGLSVHADLVYRCLRLVGDRSAPDLARTLGLSLRRTTDALEELESCAAVVPVVEGPRRRIWSAAEPDAFVPALRQRRARFVAVRQALARNLSIVDITGVTLDRLEQVRPIGDVEVARRRYYERITSARTELLSMNPEAAFSAASAQVGVPASRSALRNGAKTHSLGVPAADEDESEPYSAELDAYGLEYRELPTQPVKLTIVDRQVAFFPIDPSQNYYGGLWEISTPTLVEELASFFLRRWEVAVAPPSDWRAPLQLTERERAVLAALAQGDTDDMAAKRLRLSSRTIRYVIRDLMERYQVKTRFQLGLVVGRLEEGEDR